jgi:hypothetical protein
MLSSPAVQRPDFLRTSTLCLALLILAPILVKAPLLLGLLLPDPALLQGGMTIGLQPGILNGYPPFPTIDPNIAFTSHALGRRAVLELLSGNLPWWNHFEGVGVPLAGEMQSAALFPLTWLLLLKDGQLYMHIALQIIAGTSTWALLRRLGCNVPGALTGALVFEFNGTFAWLANAVINPIAFLPVTILGIEKIFEHVTHARKGGIAWLAIGLAASLYAGFPEVAYLDGLLALLWTIVRIAELPSAQRRIFLFRIVYGGLAGLAIAAPIVVAFFDYLPLANTGGHDAGGFALAHISPAYLLALFIPYAFGGIFTLPQFNDFWGNVGGYAGCVLMVLAVYGVLGATHRRLRIALFLWVIASLLITFGAPGTTTLTRVIPGFKLIALYRYLPASWEFSLCVLAAFALSDLMTAPNWTRLKVATGLVVIGCLASWAVLKAHGLQPAGRLAHGGLIAGILVLIATVCVVWLPQSVKWRSRALAMFASLEALLYFIVPTLSFPSKGTLDLAPVHFLQANLGVQRFATLGPIAPNYGSFFGIASVNHNDLPIPKDWTTYVERHLDNNTSPIIFNGGARNDPAGPGAADNLVTNLDGYARAGVRYVVVPKDFATLPGFGKLAHHLSMSTPPVLTRVFESQTMQILELADPRSYFTAPGCTLAAENRNTVRVRCAQPSTLTRLELYMPGWTATVDDRPEVINRTDEIFQSMRVPAGDARVVYAFQPPYMRWAYFLFVLGWLCLGFDLVRRRRRVTDPSAPRRRL